MPFLLAQLRGGCGGLGLEVLEFSSESLKTRDALWSHLHDVAVGSWSWLIGRQEPLVVIHNDASGADGKGSDGVCSLTRG